MIDKDETNATDIVTLGLRIATGYARRCARRPKHGSCYYWA
jgi:hypothetical protein